MKTLRFTAEGTCVYDAEIKVPDGTSLKEAIAIANKRLSDPDDTGIPGDNVNIYAGSSHVLIRTAELEGDGE